MTKRYLLILIGLFFYSALHAQENLPGVVEREQQRKEGGFFPRQSTILGEEDALTEEEKQAVKDFGVIRTSIPARYFQASSETSIEWDSNARLATSNEQDSSIVSERLNLRYSREFLPQWTVSSTLRQQFFWFTEIPSADFQGQALDNEVSYQVKDVLPKFRGLAFDPRYFIGCNLYRYEDYNNASQLVQAVTIRGGADHAIPFFNGKSALFYGYVGSADAASPSTFTKQQHQVFGGWNQTLIPRFVSGQSYFRFVYSDYLNIDREDKNYLAGLNVKYRVNEWFNISAFTNYTINDSNLAEYRNLSAGIVLNLAYRF